MLLLTVLLAYFDFSIKTHYIMLHRKARKGSGQSNSPNLTRDITDVKRVVFPTWSRINIDVKKKSLLLTEILTTSSEDILMTRLIIHNLWVCCCCCCWCRFFTQARTKVETSWYRFTGYYRKLMLTWPIYWLF